ncbi:MAG: ribonuclease PH [Candidatus Saganbacteria bacterium]|nr:ribonuclease PH [Candidatus Saganbacteria bacterium]
MKRSDGRGAAEARPARITRHYLKYPPGSVLIEMGETKVICTASIQEKVPDHKRGSGSGWVTAEYAMIPGATAQRNQREQGAGRPKGRTQEIQRLIGRALRAVVDLGKLGERSVLIDADVIQADGGTRTAAITGSFVALHDAVDRLLKDGKIDENPLKEFVAAVSVGVVDGETLLDLNYEEDSRAEVDMNLVATETGRLVELQGTAEAAPFTRSELEKMLALGEKGIGRLIMLQKKMIGKVK